MPLFRPVSYDIWAPNPGAPGAWPGLLHYCALAQGHTHSAGENGTTKIHVSSIIVRRGYRYREIIKRVNDFFVDYVDCIKIDLKNETLPTENLKIG